MSFSFHVCSFHFVSFRFDFVSVHLVSFRVRFRSNFVLMSFKFRLNVVERCYICVTCLGNLSAILLDPGRAGPG